MAVGGFRTPFSTMAEAYEGIGVPSMFLAEALGLLTLAALRPGERVLDVACGTGIVARLAAPRVGSTGQVVGIDLNEGMLAVARAARAPAGAAVDWQQGDTLALPFGDACFDAVLCQNGLQFMTDRARALREMRRVLRPDRRLVAGIVARDAASQAVEEAIAGYLAGDVVTMLREPFALGAGDAFTRLFDGMDFRAVDITRQTIPARSTDPDAFLAFTLNARLASVLPTLDADRQAALLANARAALAPYVGDAGLVFPVEMLVAVART